MLLRNEIHMTFSLRRIGKSIELPPRPSATPPVPGGVAEGRGGSSIDFPTLLFSSSETLRSSPLREPAKRSGNHCALLREQCFARPACRMPSLRGPSHRSEVFPSQQSQRHWTGSAARAAGL